MHLIYKRKLLTLQLLLDIGLARRISGEAADPLVLRSLKGTPPISLFVRVSFLGATCEL